MKVKIGQVEEESLEVNRKNNILKGVSLLIIKCLILRRNWLRGSLASKRILHVVRLSRQRYGMIY